MSELEGKVVLITGGAGGLGSAAARAVAARGARVMVSDVDAEGGAAVAEEVGGEFLRCDVSSLEENRAMFDATVETFGGLDHIYLNAGVASGIGLGDDFDVDTYRRVMGINLDGVVFGAHEAIRVLREQGVDPSSRPRRSPGSPQSPTTPSTRRTSTPSSAWPAPSDRVSSTRGSASTRSARASLSRGSSPRSATP